MVNKFVPNLCIECGAVLTEEEIKMFWEGPYCCSGYGCGCYGLPIDPPYCKKCLGEPNESEVINE
jgi:predicted Zn-ribbon and HTH transcriptional regulator